MKKTKVSELKRQYLSFMPEKELNSLTSKEVKSYVSMIQSARRIAHLEFQELLDPANTTADGYFLKAHFEKEKEVKFKDIFEFSRAFEALPKREKKHYYELSKQNTPRIDEFQVYEEDEEEVYDEEVFR